MDSIFRKAHGAAGYFNVVKIAYDEPRRFGKNGELLIAYDETEEHAQRQASVVSAGGKAGMGLDGGEDGKGVVREVE